MCLLMLIKGAKGVIGYSYFDIFSRGAEPDSEKRLPEVCRVGKILKELAPFIMSEKGGTVVIVEKKEGNVQAKAFTDNTGKIKILIAGIGPGKSEAIINIPEAPALKSRSGRIRTLKPGQYLFQGENICSDILE